jgi:hypothetical protein
MELEPKAPKVRDALVDLVKKYPRNATVAELLVRSCEGISGAPSGALDAVRRSGGAPVVAVAACASFFRRGAWLPCVELAERAGVSSELIAFALAKVGRIEEARARLVAFGDAASPFLVLFGLAHDDAATLEQGILAATIAQREALASVRAGTKVPAHLAWCVVAWLDQAIVIQDEKTIGMLSASLPWSPARRAAHRALVTYDKLDPMAALKLALEHTGEPEALEVIGLVAHAHGDFAAAAGVLGMRAQAGDAAVRVHLKAADALRRLGKKTEADAMLALGVESRPASKGLAAKPAGGKRRVA